MSFQIFRAEVGAKCPRRLHHPTLHLSPFEEIHQAETRPIGNRKIWGQSPHRHPLVPKWSFPRIAVALEQSDDGLPRPNSAFCLLDPLRVALRFVS